MKRGGPLKRGKPLERGSGLARTGGLSRGSGLSRGAPLDRGSSSLSRGSGLAPRSKARSKQMRGDRVPYLLSLVNAGFGCEVCPVLDEGGIEVHCSGQIEGLHERRKSGAGGSRLNRDNLIPSCNWGNGFMEDAVGSDRAYIESHEVGLVVREGHPDWDRLSKRHDRTAEDL